MIDEKTGKCGSCDTTMPLNIRGIWGTPSNVDQTKQPLARPAEPAASSVQRMQPVDARAIDGGAMSTNGEATATTWPDRMRLSSATIGAEPDAAPTSPIDQMLADIYAATRLNNDGAVADYIPELAKTDPDAFGIALATSKGKIHSIGQAHLEFTIQSTSKALTYCLALELCGREQVFERVGVEPSGDPFNAIEFSPVTRRPYNPMVNAGAIAVSGMLRDKVGASGVLDLLLDRFSQAAGRRLHVNEQVYRSEALTGHRNRAIAHLLLSVGALSGSVDETLDLYFKQCSIMVTATDLAVIGATFANLGVSPVTGRQVFDIDAVRDAQAVMFTCGMYDYSGGWAFNVGIPAKSGVGGGIMGVVNRQLGVGTYSPRVDRNGNSARGIASFKMLSDSLGLHAFDLTNTGSSFVSSFFDDRSADSPQS